MTETTTPWEVAATSSHSRPKGGPLMNQTHRNFEPCLYPALCEDCQGIPASVVVHLVSGEKFEYAAVQGIDLTAGEIILRPPEGEPIRFARNSVVYAGCGRVPPPVVT